MPSFKVAPSPTLLVTGHSQKGLGSVTLHKRPFPPHPNPSLSPNIHSNGRENTGTNRHTKIHAYPSLPPPYTEKSKRRRGVQGGGVTFHHRLANFVKAGLYLTEVPCFLVSPHLQKSCLCPLLPPNPNDIEKILHCSICQCIGVYPVSCPTDKQMYIFMCPGM